MCGEVDAKRRAPASLMFGLLVSPKWELGTGAGGNGCGRRKGREMETYSTSLKRSVSIMRFFFGLGCWERTISAEPGAGVRVESEEFMVDENHEMGRMCSLGGADQAFYVRAGVSWAGAFLCCQGSNNQRHSCWYRTILTGLPLDG